MRNRVDAAASSFFQLSLCIIVFSCAIITLLLSVSYHATSAMSQTIKTNKGDVSLKKLNQNVFRPFGYEILTPTLPIPVLRMLEEPSCEQTFDDWTKIAREVQPETPPSRIPDGLEMQFLLNNYSAVDYSKYSNDKNSPNGEKPRHWEEIGELMSWTPKQLTDLAYGVEGLSIYNAIKYYQETIDGARGLVVGSMQPWVEVCALQNGAAHVLTAEYNRLSIQSEFQNRLESIHPNELAGNWSSYAETFDFVASFSSIEHSGIGRYGDAMDPMGDVREMRKIKCLLKTGGLLFFGAPIGDDMIVFNLHRVYGPIRMAMMSHGFELIAAFREANPETLDVTDGSQIFSHRQNTLVFRKL